MELSQLRTFRVVAETLNFTRAAERLGSRSPRSVTRSSRWRPSSASLCSSAPSVASSSHLRPGGARARDPPARRSRGPARARGRRRALARRPGARGRRDAGHRPSVRAAVRGLHACPAAHRRLVPHHGQHRRDRGRHPEWRRRRRLRVTARLFARAEIESLFETSCCSSSARAIAWRRARRPRSTTCGGSA